MPHIYAWPLAAALALLPGAAPGQTSLNPSPDLLPFRTCGVEAASTAPANAPGRLWLTWAEEGVPVVVLSRLDSPQVLREWDAVRPALEGARALVLDLRSTGGTEGAVALELARRLGSEPFAHEGRGDPALVPMVILQGRGTTDAGEGLVAALMELPHVITMGEPTLGGRTAALRPHFLVEPTREDRWMGRDRPLELAVEFLRQEVAPRSAERDGRPWPGVHER